MEFADTCFVFQEYSQANIKEGDGAEKQTYTVTKEQNSWLTQQGKYERFVWLLLLRFCNMKSHKT